MQEVLFEGTIPGGRGHLAEVHTLNAGHITPAHFHSFIEFELVVGGSGTHYVSGSAHEIEPGCAWLINYAASHGFACREALTMFNVAIDETALGDSLASRITDCAPLMCRFEPEETAHIIAQFHRLQKEDAADPLSQLASAAIITDVLVALIRRSNVTSLSAPPLVQAATAWAHRSFRGDCSLAALADELGVTANHLGTVFRNAMNMSFSDYVNNLRLRCACGMLQRGGRTVREIAAASGFTSTEYFCYVFKKNLRMTPSEYRYSQTFS